MVLGLSPVAVTMTDLHILGYNTSFGYEDSDNYYDMISIKYYY